MIGNAHKQIRKLVGSTLAALVLCGAVGFAQQEKISPLSDYQYNKKDLPQYEAIKKEADLQKRCDLLTGFIKEHPISKLLLYVVNDYQACVKPYLDKKDWAKAISMEEGLLAMLPTDETIKAAEIPAGVEEFVKVHLTPSQMAIQKALLAAHYEAKNLPKAAETAEKLYALSPDKAMLPLLMEIYLNMQNFDKYLPYAEKILAETPIDQGGYAIALQMAQVYIQKQDINAATAMLSKIMDIYGDKVPPNVPEAQWNVTRAFAYGVIAQGVYAKKDYPKALELYQKVAQFDPKRDDAYYYIAMSKWQSKDSEGAMLPFAKCLALNKTMAPKAKQFLEQIYKARNKDSLEGLDKILAQAKTELGI
jgi:tetratricopeptide (TPR) repeat protein